LEERNSDKTKGMPMDSMMDMILDMVHQREPMMVDYLLVYLKVVVISLSLAWQLVHQREPMMK